MTRDQRASIVDDIVNNLDRYGFDEVVNRLVSRIRFDMEASLPKSAKNLGPDWPRFVRETLQKATADLIDRRSDEIVDIAAELLARKAYSKKRWHTVLKEIRMEMEEED